MHWTEERIETLTELWDDGASCSQIASRLGGVTRNAVIGKVRRLGLPFRGHCGPQSHKRRTEFTFASGPSAWALEKKILGGTRPKQKKKGLTFVGAPARLPASTFVELDIPPHERRQLADLEPDHCRWPIGDPKEPDFGFCNRSRLPGAPYCDHHLRAATAPPPLRHQPTSQIPQPVEAPAARVSETV